MGVQVPQSIVLIAGPTASGKSALALAAARARGGVVINADSMQVYRNLRILTARPTPEEEALVPHRLYGMVPASQEYSAGRWLASALDEIEAAWGRGQVPILTGGTGLHFEALTKGLASVPPVPEQARAAVRARAAEFGIAALHEALKSSDPVSYERLNPLDSIRVLRATEVVEATGFPLSHWQENTRPPERLAGAVFEKYFLMQPREVLYARAETRFDAMLEAGVLEEVRALPSLPSTHPLARAHGLRELQAYLAGDISLEEAARQSKTATRRYIKRQLTWWRGRMADWQLVSPGDAAFAALTGA